MTDHLTSFFPAGRDRGVTVAVEGFFAFVWFGWGHGSATTGGQNTGRALFTPIGSMAYGYLDFNREGQA